MKQFNTIRLVLGDQLNVDHSWFKSTNEDVLYVIAEIHQEAHYVSHHIQKVVGFFAAMEQFAAALDKAGFHVLYLTLDDTADDPSLTSLIKRICKEYGCNKFEFQQPDEYRLQQQLNNISIKNVIAECFDTEHFLLPFAEIPKHFTKAKHLTMESFYRKMRKRHNILMDGTKPQGGKWNFDNSNRAKLKKQDIPNIPQPLMFSNQVSHLVKRIEKHKIHTIGNIGDDLLWPINRKQALQLLTYFCSTLLPQFGLFQDAMTERSQHKWSLYHSRLSFALNTKMLHPHQVINAALEAYYSNTNLIDIAQIEGFIRQILGWREFIRGVYWINMPQYTELNSLQANNSLPEFYWHAKTNMNCMQQAISQSLDTAYAHHIQRLMITGNFALLAGISPDQISAWYLGIYIDAIQWVETPNTRGMSQYADNGIIATKPYSASGNYINKMSDYCASCHYNVKLKTTDDACPFNSLYWHFMQRHRQRLEKNPRIGMVYRNWDKQSLDIQNDTLARGQWCIDNLEKL